MLARRLVLRTIIQRNKLTSVTSIAVKRYNTDDDQSHHHYKLAAVLFSSVLIGSAVADQSEDKKVNKRNEKKNEEIIEAGAKRDDLPTYRAEEVSKHDSKESFWVTYKHGVYDVTKFLPSHPGGEQILNAAGYSIEPFWNVYGMHKTQEVYKLLETYRIGNLHDEDVLDHSDDELWAREPPRDKRLLVKTAKPFNAETPAKILVQQFDTPNELFYVRQHMPVPELDAATHTVRVVISDARGTHHHEFSLQDLEQFPRVTIRAALMCAGNRRSEMDKMKAVKGLSWQSGAISSAVWSGVRLRDVLLHCGADLQHHEKMHVILEGADIDATGVNFSTSIPLWTALSPASDVLLATHMNGEPLPRDHGYPLRAVTPGAPAVRSVKWLQSITVSSEESPSHWHQKDYRSFNPSKTWETADFPSAPPVYSLPVTSAICDPLDGDTVRVRDGCIQLRGYAYSGGGASIIRVDLSTDRGQTWVEAQHLERDHAPPPNHYAWTLWTARVPVPDHCPQVEVWARATDSNFNTQPERFDHIWNIRGILSNAYQRITVKLQR